MKISCTIIKFIWELLNSIRCRWLFLETFYFYYKKMLKINKKDTLLISCQFSKFWYTTNSDCVVFNAKNFGVCILYVWHFGGRKKRFVELCYNAWRYKHQKRRQTLRGWESIKKNFCNVWESTLKFCCVVNRTRKLMLTIVSENKFE